MGAPAAPKLARLWSLGGAKVTLLASVAMLGLAWAVTVEPVTGMAAVGNGCGGVQVTADGTALTELRVNAMVAKSAIIWRPK